MNRSTLPLGARTPDEMLAASADPGLADHDRRAVDAWLDEHPEWRARASTYVSLGAATRAAPAERAPDVASMSDLWAAIDSDQQQRSSSPPHPSGRPDTQGRAGAPSFAPPPPTSLTGRRPRRGGTGVWLAAAAAILIVGVGSVVVITRDSGGDDEVASEEPATTDTPATDDPDSAAEQVPAPGQAQDQPAVDQTNGPAALARLQDSADNTTDAGTADVEYRMLATSDVTGSVIEDETGESIVYFEQVGIGQLEFPDRSILTTETVTRVGDRTDLLPIERGVTVQDAGRTFVRCAGEADFAEMTDDTDSNCWASGVNPDTFSPSAAIDAITGNQLDPDEIVALGDSEMPDGTAITGYQAIRPVTLDDGQTIDVTMQIWIDDDDIIRRTVASGDVNAGDNSYPTTIVMSYDLDNLGVEVDIPAMD